MTRLPYALAALLILTLLTLQLDSERTLRECTKSHTMDTCRSLLR